MTMDSPGDPAEADNKSPDSAPEPAARRSVPQRTPREEYWRRQIIRTSALLAIWAFVAYGMSIFGVELLNSVVIGGMPLGFWMAQQGSIYVFILLILCYTILSERADRKAGLHETKPFLPPETH